jgi:hypothetical protein
MTDGHELLGQVDRSIIRVSVSLIATYHRSVAQTYPTYQQESVNTPGRPERILVKAT